MINDIIIGRIIVHIGNQFNANTPINSKITSNPINNNIDNFTTHFGTL